MLSFFFFFNDTATTEIYTLSLHDALPICRCGRLAGLDLGLWSNAPGRGRAGGEDRKSTRLNSSHDQISYAVFCLKKKKETCDGDVELCATVRTGSRRRRADPTNPTWRTEA